MTKLRHTLFALACFLSTATQAADNLCSELKNAQQVIACALSNSPEVLKAQAAFEQASQLEDQASQRPNPEIGGTATYGKQLGDTVLNVDANLTHTFELGGKRGSRIEKAQGLQSKSAADLLKAKETTVVQTMEVLIRLRQIQSEIDAVDEALTTFDKILKQYESRPRLSPEQQVSFSVFQLAAGDYRIKKTQLEVEQYQKKQEINAILGKAFDLTSSIFPKTLNSWPTFSEAIPSSSFMGSMALESRATLQTAQAEYELEKSESWPNLRAGPSIQDQAQGPLRTQAIGINLSFNLPVFHMNGGGRAVGLKGVMKSETELQMTYRELTAERASILNQYKMTVKTLSESLSFKEIEKRHHNVESLFERGVISSPLVIEAHRQMVDYTQSKNQNELSAMKSLWKLKAFEGKLVSEVISP